MTNFKKQAFSVLAAGSLLGSLVTPAMASTEITISGNGAGSTNYTNVSQTSGTTVSQNNVANVTNHVDSNANTGNNESSLNTGGNTMIKTGAAQVQTTVTNSLNSNAAQVAGCNCGSDVNVKVSGNGADSTNQVGAQYAPLTVTNSTNVQQGNNAQVTNDVDSNAKTGRNDANLNTGGSTAIQTGAATAVSNVNTTANANSAVVGSSAVGAVAPSATFMVTGNGAGSNNWIGATLSNSTILGQNNIADVDNFVNSDAKTGKNSAESNTGGSVSIQTGAAGAGVNVDNMTNFNVANVDCGCTFDVLAKIAGNGANANSEDPTKNSINLNLSNINQVGSYNNADLNNCLFADAKTGHNDANLNGGDNYIDPSIVTGAATDITGVNNSGNVNTVGSSPIVFPTIPVGGTNVGVSFNIQALLAFFGWSMSN